MGTRQDVARPVGLEALERDLLSGAPLRPRIVYRGGQRVARDDFDPDQARDEHGEWSAGPGGSKVYKAPPVKAGSPHTSAYVKTVPGDAIEGKGYMGVRKDLIHEVHEFSGASGLRAIVVRKDGIKVYKQTDAFKQKQADKKFARSLRMGEHLGAIRASYTKDMLSTDPATRDKATVLALIDKHCIRVGGSAAEDRTGSKGATTIEAKHLQDKDGKLSIRFPGKSGVRWNVKVTDPQLAKNLREAAAGKKPGAELFPHATPQNVNAYIRDVAGTKLTAKDFRTFHASVIARAELRALPEPKTAKQLAANEKTAIAHTAAVLGHTAAVCRGSYINPRVLQAYEESFHAAHAA